jgi:Glycosyltransferase sugar-binding region containing DXD motif
MHLNQLYGYFGRKQMLLETVNIYNRELPSYLLKNKIKNIIKINSEISLLLLETNVDPVFIDNLNSFISKETKWINTMKIVKAQVGIAAAVTAYARIHMIDYKLLPGTIYTDTDSIFTTDILPDELVGKRIGTNER